MKSMLVFRRSSVGIAVAIMAGTLLFTSARAQDVTRTGEGAGNREGSRASGLAKKAKQTIDEQMKMAGAEIRIYKETVDSEGSPVSLKAYVFSPKDSAGIAARPAVVFFFGGGWKGGTPGQFLEHCKHLASKGLVAITADYRVKGRQGTLAKECVADGKSAIRWVRREAKSLGVDPDRVVAAGGSAGGHVAACTGVLDGFDEPGDDSQVSSRPNAMALFNPAVLLAPIDDRHPLDPEKLKGLRERMGVAPIKLSPVHHVHSQTPPAIIFHGRDDSTVPFWTVEAFDRAMEAEGVPCRLVGFDGEGHGFFNYGRGDNSNYLTTLRELDRFLAELGYLQTPNG